MAIEARLSRLGAIGIAAVTRTGNQLHLLRPRRAVTPDVSRNFVTGESRQSDVNQRDTGLQLVRPPQPVGPISAYSTPCPHIVNSRPSDSRCRRWQRVQTYIYKTQRIAPSTYAISPAGAFLSNSLARTQYFSERGSCCGSPVTRPGKLGKRTLSRLPLVVSQLAHA